MIEKISIAVIIPAFRVSETITNVVKTIPDAVDWIIVVDDCCPENSGKLIESLNLPKVIVLYHLKNKGVGGAMKSGYQKAIDLNVDICIKMDGDGQMNPDYLTKLISPLLNRLADYSKGNRFYDIQRLKSMPKARLLGNSILSFILKAVSGYWCIMDPTNGYTAITINQIRKLPLEQIEDGYFFESDMLFYLNQSNAIICDVPIPAYYENHHSSMQLSRIIFSFPGKLINRFFRRIFFRYFIYDFNMASIYILIGVPLFLWGFGFGLIEWIMSYISNEVRSTGTIILSALPIIISTQMLLEAIHIDIGNTPKINKKISISDNEFYEK